VRLRPLVGLGGRGILTSVVSTGAVAPVTVVGVVSVRPEVTGVVVGAVVAVVAAVVGAADDEGVAGVPPSFEETTKATASPAAAATATAAASRAFFTWQEATLARPCQNGSKSS
jgi:hypothetical protein